MELVHPGFRVGPGPVPCKRRTVLTGLLVTGAENTEKERSQADLDAAKAEYESENHEDSDDDDDGPVTVDIDD